MNKLIPILAILVLPALAQGQQESQEHFSGYTPKAEIFAGYSYLNVDTNNLTSRQSAHGWETSISGNFNKWLAVEFDVSGHYKTYGVDLGNVLPGAGVLDVRVTDYSYLAGPRINLRPLFVHALFGGDHLTGSAAGFSASQDSFAGVVGGGVQVPLTRLLSIRASADYALSRHNIFGGPSVSQNNFRTSVGIVFKFGGTRAERGSVPSPAAHPTGKAEPPAPEVEVTSLGLVGYGTVEGFRVTSVREGSSAAQIFIRPGDVILKIDEKRTQSGEDIDAAVAESATGKIKVVGLTRTAVMTVVFEREVNVR